MGKTGESRRRKARGPSFRGWQPAPERRILSCSSIGMAFLSIPLNWILRFSTIGMCTGAFGPLFPHMTANPLPDLFSIIHRTEFACASAWEDRGHLGTVRRDGGRGVDRAALRKRNRMSRSEGGGSGKVAGKNKAFELVRHSWKYDLREGSDPGKTLAGYFPYHMFIDSKKEWR